MFISKFMTKDVITLGSDSDIAEAKQLMIRYRIRHLPVTRPDRTLIGIVSDRDVRSAMPSKFFNDHGIEETETDRLTGVLVQEIMTKDPVSVSLSSTIQDALLLIEKTRVGAFPVVDENLKVVGIVSDRDLLNAFIHVMGIKKPGALLGIVVDEKNEEIEHIIHALVSENISFGSILVYRNWSPGKRAVFPYLLAKNVVNLKQKLRNMGYDILDPIEWYIHQRR
ncbi:CBS domain-containing protein [uncultured Desulfosarcina sp.]|uniref:CBS domain-containing protein n=1 Tax=uncultured Desulfosarcina sp. TaxID=218289 RepID=UPI0029C641EB|nr:CBS domain-containing protein [uncultured Desulfosarcina sp.]